MSHLKKYLLFWLVGLSLFVGLNDAALAAPPGQNGDNVSVAHVRPDEPVGYVLAGYLNVRSGPGTHYATLARLRYGEMIWLSGRNAETSWLQVRLGYGQQGWVSARYVDANDAVLSNLPVIDEDGSLDPVGYVGSYRLNVRTGPGLYYPVIHRLRRGESVILLGRNYPGTWLKVQAPGGGLGWVSTRYIWSHTSIYNLPISDDGQPQPPSHIGYVRGYTLNMRSGPGLYYPVIDMLYYDQEVHLSGRNVEGSWLKISLADGSRQGWVSARYIWSHTPFNHLPVVW